MELATARDVATREDEGQTIKLRDENGEVSAGGETITVAGTYSGIFRRAQDSQRNRLLKQRKQTLTGDDLMQNQMELAASCVLAWTGFTNAGGPFPCTKENAVLLLTQAPWIREQVEEAMNDHQNFSSRPATS